jgi:hypothetical protein
MQPNADAIAARKWQRELDATASQTLEIVSLFSVLALVALVVVLLTSSAHNAAVMTAALM